MTDERRQTLESLHERVIACAQCDRLRAYCRDVGAARRAAYRGLDYWAKPVPGFGDPHARLWIIGLAPDYSWAVVGDPGREYLWILARSRQLDDTAMAAARAAARDNGYDVNRLVLTPQGRNYP